MPLTLADLCDDAAFLSFETQLHLIDVLGDRRWGVEMDSGRFVFSGGTGDHKGDIVCDRMHLVGTAASGPRSWQWSWASSQGWPADIVDLATWLRGFGEQHGVRELSEPQIAFAELRADDPVGVAAILADATKAASARWAAYTPEAAPDTRAVFLLDHPSFALPAPAGTRVVRVLSEGLMGAGMLTDHRRAVAAYAAARPLGSQTTPDGNIELRCPEGTVSVRFDELDRIAGVQAQLG